MEKFIIGPEHLQYNVQAGKIIQINANSKLVVSGSGGTGSTYQGTGAGGTVNISSHTINYQDNYLEDAKGSQFVVNLTDWNISAIEGHELVLIWVESFNNRNYALIYNKTLDLVYYSNLQKYFKITSDNVGCAKILGGVLLAIFVPTVAYGATRSILVGFISFVAMVVVIVKIAKGHSKEKQSGEDLGEKLRMNVLEILQKHKG